MGARGAPAGVHMATGPAPNLVEVSGPTTFPQKGMHGINGKHANWCTSVRGMEARQRAPEAEKARHCTAVMNATHGSKGNDSIAPSSATASSRALAVPAMAAGGECTRESPAELAFASAPSEPLGPAALLRKVLLPPKSPEDNYEISDNGGDSDDEARNGDRRSKHVPKWCTSFLTMLERQADVDPDTIWGSRVPQCVLDDVFPDAAYQQAGLQRPKRARGSSGDWKKDRLTGNEICRYKTRMGHARPWNEVPKPAVSQAGSGSAVSSRSNPLPKP